jgi:3',5'-cyclic AMP phosphodiesterase CpdA
MFTLAHLSDPHLAPLPAARVSELLGKRITGLLNWQRKRRFIHRADVLARIVADLKASAADHLAVTGDLVNLSLAAEFPLARRWLESLGGPADVSLVPGNHDAYVSEAAGWPQQHWGDYMRGDGGESFPFVRRRGPVALIGLTTAVPTAPFQATGALGAAQMARCAQVLTEQHDAFRIVLIHHPPRRIPRARHKRLVDAAEFRAMLAAAGADLVIHGHDHIASLEWLDGPRGRIPLVGVPSASAAPGGHDTAAAYNLYRIERAAGAWRCEMVALGFAGNGGGDIVELSRATLTA